MYINDKYMMQINDSATYSTEKQLEYIQTNPKRIEKIRRGIYSINFKNCILSANLNSAKKVVTKLNIRLREKCPGLYLQLDYMYNMQGTAISYNNNPNNLLLCLYSKTCISSVELIIKNGVISINSITATEHGGKKYNKLLRGYSVLIAKALKCTAIHSDAINPISALLLVNYYNAVIPKTTENEHFNEFNDKNLPITKELIQSYDRSLKNDFRRVFEIGLVIDVTDPVTIKKTNTTISKVLEEIVC